PQPQRRSTRTQYVDARTYDGAAKQRDHRHTRWRFERKPVQHVHEQARSQEQWKRSRLDLRAHRPDGPARTTPLAEIRITGVRHRLCVLLKNEPRPGHGEHETVEEAAPPRAATSDSGIGDVEWIPPLRQFSGIIEHYRLLALVE